MVIVQKFGGTSVGTMDQIRSVAKLLTKSKQEGNAVVGVVSAMSGETNRLVKLATEINPMPWSAEYDMLLAAGEQQAAALLALAINSIGGKARPLLGHQVGIYTDKLYSKARITGIDTATLRSCLASDTIPIVAGFQGVDDENNITTLGRGGSNTSAVAIAAALKADDCEIFTDVEGVFTTDPRLCGKARKLPEVSYDEMIEMASLGAKVLQIRSVELAAKYKVPLHVRSSFNLVSGTRIIEEPKMEQLLIRGIAAERENARISVTGTADQRGFLGKIFEPLANAGIVVDGIVQYGHTVSFTVCELEADRVKLLLSKQFPEMDFALELGLAKVSIIGLGIRNHPFVAARAFKTLEEANIKISHTATSEIKVSMVVDGSVAKTCVEKLHTAFGLDG